MKRLCIYHGGCTDGVAAAWAVYQAEPSYTFFPGVYQKEPPWHLIDSDTLVLFVDFSYTRPVLEQIIGKARKVVVLDHHKTARESLEDLLTKDKIQGTFDMDRCGAMITWDWFFPNQPAPPLLEEIDKYDRWLDTRDPKLIIALRSYPHAPVDESSAAWSILMDLWSSLMAADQIGFLRSEGTSIYRYYRRRIEETKPHARMIILGDARIPTVNAPYYLASDVAGELAEDNEGIGSVWWQNRDGSVTFSLRSRGDYDVSALAKIYGGGGHKDAAGFTVTAEKAATILFRGD